MPSSSRAMFPWWPLGLRDREVLLTRNRILSLQRQVMSHLQLSISSSPDVLSSFSPVPDVLRRPQHDHRRHHVPGKARGGRRRRRPPRLVVAAPLAVARPGGPAGLLRCSLLRRHRRHRSQDVQLQVVQGAVPPVPTGGPLGRVVERKPQTGKKLGEKTLLRVLTKCYFYAGLLPCTQHLSEQAAFPLRRALPHLSLIPQAHAQGEGQVLQLRRPGLSVHLGKHQEQRIQQVQSSLNITIMSVSSKPIVILRLIAILRL